MTAHDPLRLTPIAYVTIQGKGWAACVFAAVGLAANDGLYAINT